MSTTAVIIEHLVGGILTALWIVIVFGHAWIPWDQLETVATQVSIVAFAVAYPVGIFVDEAADRIFRSSSTKIRKRRLIQEGLNPKTNEISVFNLLRRTDNDFPKTYFNYSRTRIRMSRSAVFNFVPLTIATAFFSWVQLSVDFRVILAELFIGLALTALALHAWNRSTNTFWKRLAIAWASHSDSAP